MVPPEVFLLAVFPVLGVIACCDAFLGVSERVRRWLSISRELSLLIILIASATVLTVGVNMYFSKHPMFAIINMNDAEAELSRIEVIRAFAFIDVVLIVISIFLSAWVAYRRKVSIGLYVLVSVFGNIGFILWEIRNKDVRD